MTESWWREQPIHDQVLSPGLEPMADPTGRLEPMLRTWSGEFARRRFNSDEPELRLGSRGLHPDEAAAFLHAVDAGQLEVDDAGYVTPLACRPKPGGGRYALFSANSSVDVPYVSLNTEYLIQFGAAAELVTCWGWNDEEVRVEVGEFDAVAEDEGRVVLAMEAKARVDGPDSLGRLFEAFVRFGLEPEPPEPTDNASRKYVELLRLTESGPVILWLVAAGARWAFEARRTDRRIRLEPIPDPSRGRTTAWVPAPSPSLPAPLAPATDHAVAVARLTERDGAQRVYEFPWSSESDLRNFVTELRSELERMAFRHARPWVWQQSTGGLPMTPCGGDTGLELRFSFYA